MKNRCHRKVLQLQIDSESSIDCRQCYVCSVVPSRASGRRYVIGQACLSVYLCVCVCQLVSALTAEQLCVTSWRHVTSWHDVMTALGKITNKAGTTPEGASTLRHFHLHVNSERLKGSLSIYVRKLSCYDINPLSPRHHTAHSHIYSKLMTTVTHFGGDNSFCRRDL